MKSECHCGKSKVTILNQEHNSLNCHCNICRSHSGAAFTTWVTIAATEVDILTASHELTSYQFGEYGSTYFCKHCGTSVYTLDNRHPNIVAFRAGTLKDFTISAPISDYFYDHKAEWYSPTIGSKTYGGKDGFTEITGP